MIGSTLLWACLVGVIAASPKCTRQLQEIIFQPRSFSKEYLEKVAIKFKTGSDLLFTSQASAYIAQFEQQWGVSVSVKDPSNICAPAGDLVCFDFGESYPGLGQRVVAGGFNTSSTTIDPPIPYPIESISLKTLRGNYSDSTPYNYFFSVNLIAYGGTTVDLVTTFNGCQTQSFNFTMADSGSLILGTPNGTCTGIDSSPTTTVFKPVQSFADTLVGKELLRGDWALFFTNQNANATLYIQEFTFTACYNQPASVICSSDVMHSLINVPGFRVSSGIAYYTEEIYSTDGQMLSYTISRPLA